MRAALSCVVVATLHLVMPLLVAAQADASTPPPPEIKINPQSAAAAMSAGISAETLDAVAKAIQAYGVTWDRGDEKQHRETITGAPALIDMAVASLHAEQAENAASQLAREKLPGRPVQPGTTQPSQREPYPRTDYHSRVLAENVTIKGDNQRVTIARPPRTEPSYVAEKTPQGWRIVIGEDELRGAPAEKVTELFKQQRDAYEKLREQIAAGQLKTWQEFSDASGQIRKTFRAGVKAAAPAGGSAK